MQLDVEPYAKEYREHRQPVSRGRRKTMGRTAVLSERKTGCRAPMGNGGLWAGGREFCVRSEIYVPRPSVRRPPRRLTKRRLRAPMA